MQTHLNNIADVVLKACKHNTVEVAYVLDYGLYSYHT